MTRVCGSPSLITSTVFGIAGLPVFLIIVEITCSAVLFTFCEFCPKSNPGPTEINIIEKIIDKVFIK
jgi:hypothetical protein